MVKVIPKKSINKFPYPHNTYSQEFHINQEGKLEIPKLSLYVTSDGASQNIF